MGSKVIWAQMPGSRFSGPSVKGTCRYTLPANPTGFDVIVAATARPEGGSFDVVNMYDGTAVTYGLMQWTFTSGRLHKLLWVTQKAMGLEAYERLFGPKLGFLTDLMVQPEDGSLWWAGNKVTDYFSLRDICTPPGGAVPRQGKNWELAKSIALLFGKLGEDQIAQRVQLEFFMAELADECRPRRPKMGGRRISDYLYPAGYDNGSGPTFDPVLKAARALFWSAWQNAPRKAEQYLDSALRDVEKPLSTQKGLDRLAKKMAYSSFARWGVTKARNHMDPKTGKPKPYTSRYEKMAKAINEIMGQVIVPELWRR